MSICPDIQSQQFENTEGSVSTNQAVNDADEEESNMDEAVIARLG